MKQLNSIKRNRFFLIPMMCNFATIKTRKEKAFRGNALSSNLFQIRVKVFFLYFLFTPCFSFSYNPDHKPLASEIPEPLKGLKIEEHLGEHLNLNLSFTNEHGQTVPLSRFFKADQPVLMTIVYYNCPKICGLLLTQMAKALKTLESSFKKQFQFVVLSMDHTETFRLAAEKKSNYVKQYSLTGDNTHFLTGTKENIAALSKQLGFQFRWVESQKIFAHHPVAYVLSPKAKITRYLYGLDFESQSLKLSLVEASLGRIGTIVDRILLFCYQFDPNSGKYSWYAYNIMRAGGALTFFLILFLLLPVWIKENRKLKLKKNHNLSHE